MTATQEPSTDYASARQSALLRKYENATAARHELDELRVMLGGRLPHETAAPVEPAPDVPPPARVNKAPIYKLPPVTPAPKWKGSRLVDAAGFVQDLFKRGIRPRPTETIGAWAESEGLMIPAEESHGEPGRYREGTEPTATIIHKFLQDDRYRVFIGPKPSRMGYTLAAIVAICYWLKHYAVNIIFCIDDQRQVKKFARTRLIPMIKSLRCLRDIMPTSKRALNATALFFRGITLHLAGARSISDVTSITAGLFFADECDQYKNFATGEAGAMFHLVDRIMDVPGAKGVFFGKPRNEADFLHTQMMTGTRHQCFVKCPHCGFDQPLVFKQLKFDHCKLENGNYDLLRVERETYYECANPVCVASETKGRIEERHKPAMINAHEWRQTYFGDDPDYQLDPRKMSIIPASQLYSLRRMLTWGVIAADFIKAQREGGAAIAHFFRTRFGEAERQAQTVTKKEEVLKLQHFIPRKWLQKWWADGHKTELAQLPRRHYQHGHCPFPPVIVLMFSDVQTVLNEKKWVKMAFHVSGEAAIVDYGICKSYSLLIKEADKPVMVDDWQDTPEDERINPIVSYCWIDEGGSTTGVEKHVIEVREFCAREETWGRFFPAKGAGGGQIAHPVEEKIRADVTSSEGELVDVPAFHFSHDLFAGELFYGRIKKHDEILLAIAQGFPPENQPLWIPEFPDDQFIEEMVSEILIKKRVRGRMCYVWQKTGKRINDFPDGVKGCLGMWHHVKADFMGGRNAADETEPDDNGEVDDDSEDDMEEDGH
jgi:phage terminase large subunit GpA-like protein